VLDEPSHQELRIEDKDVKITTKRGSGPGGQHRNKTDSCVEIKHLETGITVTIDGRSQHANRSLAFEILRAKLLDSQRECGILQRNESRRDQVGCGMRGDKRRTIRVNDNQVTDHTLGRTTTFKDYLKGNFDRFIS